MSTRWQLERSYTLSKKRNFDIEKFNSLTHEHALVSEQLARLEDELQVIPHDGDSELIFILQLLLTEEAIQSEEHAVKTNDSFLDF